MNYTKTIREFCLNNKGRLLDASIMLDEYFSMVPYKTFLKIINRLEEEGIVTTVSKGVYKINGTDKTLEEMIEEEYIDHEHGMYIGKRLYEYYDIGTSNSQYIEILTNKIKRNDKTIGKYKLIYTNIDFRKAVVEVITSLELIENHSDIINENMVRYAEETSGCLAASYSKSVLEDILKAREYKYSTICTVQRLLREMDKKDPCVDVYHELYLKKS